MTILTHPEITTLNELNIEKLFVIFKKDFIDNQTSLKKGYASFLVDVKADKICPCPFTKEDKPERFWHIITKEEKRTRHRNNPCPDEVEKNRKYDEARAKRIHWIKILIDTWQTDGKIKHFYQRRDSKTTLVIWHTTKDFVVIIRKLSNTTNKFLVSSYLVFRTEVKRYEKQLREYNAEAPNGLEWF